jgi:NADP-dependent 3-hydroxy acid dehydrogenase YdfG
LSIEPDMTRSPVILITGASSGIGAATARLFGGRGYRVVLAARREDRLETLAGEIRQSGGEALPVATDVSQLDQIERLVETAMEAYETIDVLLNNAGFGRMNWLEAMDPREDIDLQLQVNLRGVIHTSRVVLPHMIRQRNGHIINMASIASLIAPPTYSIYAASKFGVRGFTQALHREVDVYGIRVSGIYPGGVDTEFSQHMGRKPKTGITSPSMLQLTAKDVAEVVWRVVKRPCRMVIIPGIMRPVVWLNTIAPGIIDWGIRQVFTKPERGITPKNSP